MCSQQFHRSNHNHMCQGKIRVTFPNLVDFHLSRTVNLYGMPRVQYLAPEFIIYTKKGMDCPLSNETGLTEFVSSLKKM
jgi:hypothetical protein